MEGFKCHTENVASDAISRKKSHIFCESGNVLHLWKGATANFYKEANKRMKYHIQNWYKRNILITDF